MLNLGNTYFVVNCFYWENLWTENWKLKKRKKRRKSTHKRQQWDFAFFPLFRDSIWSCSLENKHRNATRKIGEKKECLHVPDLLCSKSCASRCTEYVILNMHHSSTLFFSLVMKLFWKIPNICCYVNKEITLTLVWKNQYFLLNSTKIQV